MLTMLFSRVRRTSAMPLGADSTAASVRVRVMGNRKLPITATPAARKVVSIYRTTTVRKRLPMPTLALAREAMTSTNTSTGATAFSAPTKMSPRMVRMVRLGATTPRTAPRIRPTRMRRIREMPCQRLTIAFILRFPFSYGGAGAGRCPRPPCHFCRSYKDRRTAFSPTPGAKCIT